MKYALLATALFASPALGQTTTAPFADTSNCPGLTYQLDGTNGWNYGGTGDGLSNGNASYASNQVSNPSPAVTAAGAGLNVGVVQTGGGLTGTMINTHHQFSQTYGYFELNATLTAGALQPGMTTSVWLMPENGGWPPEIDIEETAGANSDTAVHACDGCGSAVSQQYNIQPGKHVWAVDWNQQNITFYIDGKVPTNPDTGQPATTPTPPNFHQPMYMVIDAMSQGATGGMQIETLRVYKDMASAEACVVKSPGPSKANPQVNALTNQLQQIQASVPSVPATTAPAPIQSPPQAPSTSGYDPRFIQYGQQLQQQLPDIQAQLDAAQAELDALQKPPADQ